MNEKFEIKKHIAVLSESKSGWQTELNYISWFGKEPKFDIRSWFPDHEKAGKGISLSEDEVRELRIALTNIDI